MNNEIMVIDIVQEWLSKNKYDGLVSSTKDCGCTIDDLAPCGEMQETCVAGYKANCNEDCTHDGAEGPDAWHIQPECPLRKV